MFTGVLFLEIHESIRHSFMTTRSFAYWIMSTHSIILTFFSFCDDSKSHFLSRHGGGKIRAKQTKRKLSSSCDETTRTEEKQSWICPQPRQTGASKKGSKAKKASEANLASGGPQMVGDSIPSFNWPEQLTIQLKMSTLCGCVLCCETRNHAFSS